MKLLLSWGFDNDDNFKNDSYLKNKDNLKKNTYIKGNMHIHTALDISYFAVFSNVTLLSSACSHISFQMLLNVFQSHILRRIFPPLYIFGLRMMNGDQFGSGRSQTWTKIPTIQVMKLIILRSWQAPYLPLRRLQLKQQLPGLSRQCVH